VRVVVVSLVVLVGGCFDPSYPVEIPCSPEGTCPPGQMCHLGTCLTEGGGELTDCSLVEQNCAPGWKCAFTDSSEDEQRCVPNGPLEVGADCARPAEATDECAAGAVCVLDQCRAFCDGPDSCPSDSICASFTTYHLCLLRCDPLAQDCPALAAGPQGCYTTNDGPTCSRPIGNVGVGGTCEWANECARGLGCWNERCRTYCDYTRYPDQTAPSCQALQLCRHLADGYGVCE